MRIVAIDARHGALSHAMRIRLLERRPNRKMAPRALRRNIRDLSQQKRLAARAVHGMALVAPDGIFRMASLDSAHLRFISMTTQAGSVGVN